MCPRSIRSISVQLPWTFAGTARQSLNSWDRFYERDEHARIMDLGARDLWRFSA
jgi:hypothetical protein